MCFKALAFFRNSCLHLASFQILRSFDMQVMALELGKFNIRVNAIAAGIFKSEITEGLFSKPWMHKVAEKVVPMQRWGLVDPDMTSLVVLLASDSSSYISGTIFIVDGGYSISGVPLWSSL